LTEGNVVGRVDIHADGTVTKGAGAIGWTSISGIRFSIS